jgi:hypothetical protein
LFIENPKFRQNVFNFGAFRWKPLKQKFWHVARVETPSVLERVLSSSVNGIASG